MHVNSKSIHVCLQSKSIHAQDQPGAAGQAGGQGGAGAGRGGAGEENPLTPTKEEAATALASLSAEDHEAAG